MNNASIDWTGREVYLGLDLSETTDNTAVSMVAVDDDENILTSEPTVDAVQVVRCGDCKEFNQYETETGECMKYAQTRWKDNFCNYGKRRKND